MNPLPSIADGEDKSSPFVNCLRNTYRHLKKWAKRTETNCFRLYDRQLPAFPLAIDYYGDKFCVHYFAKSADSEEPSEELVKETERAINAVFNLGPETLFWRTRAKSKTTRQYEKLDARRDYFVVYENGVKFWVNLVDYLDTGLFLDHRETRKFAASLAKGKRVLNLFAYTGSFSVHAAMQGAIYTKSVDMSNTYVAWGKDNFKLNNLSEETNEWERADCLKFMTAEVRSGSKYDLIILDPPTFSRSKKMDKLFDIQVDYIYLLKHSLKLLNAGGKIIFSTNSRKFVFDQTLFPTAEVKEISDKTLPLDYQDPKIHRCWLISKLT